MKKIISLILALVMAMSLAVTAMAEDEQYTSGQTVKIRDLTTDYTKNDITVPAKGSVAEFTNENPTYYVVMTWSVESTLTYTVNSTDYKWNVYDVENNKLNNDVDEPSSVVSKDEKLPTSAKYDVNGKWTGEATIKVDVTNWSNVDITAKTTWASGKVVEDGTNGVTKDIVITGLSDGDVGTTNIDRADKGVTKDNYAGFVANANGENPAVKTENVFNKTIKTQASEDETPGVMLTDGAIKDTGNGYNAIIGTLTVTIAKNTTTSGT